ncbi:MAG: CPBP family intramembrane glutamic endopeptidase [Bacteroidota bacterium]
MTHPSPTSSSQAAVFNNLVLLLFLALLGTFIASLLISFLGNLFDLNYSETVSELQRDTSLEKKNFIRIALGITQLCTFLLPAAFFLRLTYRDTAWETAKLERSPTTKSILLVSLLTITTYPLVQYIYLLNQQLPLPTWAIEQENLINTTVQHLLYVHAVPELLINILLVGLLPAVGEELLFRGVVQQQLEKLLANPHIAVWLTALIFSFIHFQFQGFLPRVLLGAGLGYLFIWTRNLWIPIIAHFVNNAGQVLLQYLYQQQWIELNLNSIDKVPLGLLVVSMSMMGAFGYFLKISSDKKY